MKSAPPPPPLATVQTALGPVDVHEAPTGGNKAGANPRISARMRTAIQYRVRKGYNIIDACAKAGIAQDTWYKNFLKPHIKAFFEVEKLKYIQSVENLSDRHKARALEVAAQIMEESKSDAAKMRAVEFIRGGGKSGVTVNVQNNIKSTGYEYAKPGQRIVEIQGEVQDVTPDSPDE